MATITFIGAVEGVTGSAYLLQTEYSNILLECGLFQGTREVEEQNKAELPFPVKDINAVVLSHAHLDHPGRLPLIVKQGYAGSVYLTWPSYDLLEVLLKDAAYLQMRDAEWENKRRRRSKSAEVEPLYNIEDVENALAAGIGVGYHERVSGMHPEYREG